MKFETIYLQNDTWQFDLTKEDTIEAHLVLVFGDTDTILEPKHYDYLKKRYPNAQIVGSSSSGNILKKHIKNNSITATAIEFEKSSIEVQCVTFETGADIKEIVSHLVQQLSQKDLQHIFVLAEGLTISGSDVSAGLNTITNTTKSGGLAGDGERFEKTCVMANDYAKPNTIAVIGFYGDFIKIESGSFGGWREFGTPREITKSQSNVAYELDGEPILDYYKRYLGEYAQELPASGLKFPLGIRKNLDDPITIRTLIAMDEDEKSITFAGDVPQGYTAQLMKADIDLLIDGAATAAKLVNTKPNKNKTLAIAVSCTGRKAVMTKLIDAEVEAVANELGANISLIGFYSYGEIAPLRNGEYSCELHNQTMTLTLISEE